MRLCAADRLTEAWVAVRITRSMRLASAPRIARAEETDCRAASIAVSAPAALVSADNDSPPIDSAAAVALLVVTTI